MKKLILIIMLPFVAGGCGFLSYPFYVLFGRTEERVKAEYIGLKDQKIALIIFGQPGIDFEDPFARLDLALATEQAIIQNVKTTEFADQEEIQSFQRARLDWYSLPMSEIAAKFQVQRVLYLELIQFTIREIDTVNLLRGRIWAQLSVFEADSAQPDVPAYESEVEIVFPEQAPEPYSENAKFAIRRESIRLFALETARKFHDHKKKVK